MFHNQCISVTDLRKKTKDCLKNLSQGEKYIFINNKPVAVLVSMNTYEEIFGNPVLQEASQKDLTPDILKKASRTRKMRSSDFVNL